MDILNEYHLTQLGFATPSDPGASICLDIWQDELTDGVLITDHNHFVYLRGDWATMTTPYFGKDGEVLGYEEEAFRRQPESSSNEKEKAQEKAQVRDAINWWIEKSKTEKQSAEKRAEACAKDGAGGVWSAVPDSPYFRHSGNNCRLRPRGQSRKPKRGSRMGTHLSFVLTKPSNQAESGSQVYGGQSAVDGGAIDYATRTLLDDAKNMYYTF